MFPRLTCVDEAERCDVAPARSQFVRVILRRMETLPAISTSFSGRISMRGVPRCGLELVLPPPQRHEMSRDHISANVGDGVEAYGGIETTRFFFVALLAARFEAVRSAEALRKRLRLCLI